jgi:hypothetical protein
MTYDPQDELLSAYLDGELSGDELRRVEQLLVDNAEYRQLYEELRALGSSFQALPRYRLAEDLSQRVLRRAEQSLLDGSTGLQGEARNIPAVDLVPGAASGAADRLSGVGLSGAGLAAQGPVVRSSNENASDANLSGGTRAAGRRPHWRAVVWPVLVLAAAVLMMVFNPNRREHGRRIAQVTDDERFAKKHASKDISDPAIDGMPDGGPSDARQAPQAWIGAAPEEGAQLDTFAEPGSSADEADTKQAVPAERRLLRDGRKALAAEEPSPGEPTRGERWQLGVEEQTATENQTAAEEKAAADRRPGAALQRDVKADFEKTASAPHAPAAPAAAPTAATGAATNRADTNRADTADSLTSAPLPADDLPAAVPAAALAGTAGKGTAMLPNDGRAGRAPVNDAERPVAENAAAVTKAGRRPAPFDNRDADTLVVEVQLTPQAARDGAFAELLARHQLVQETTLSYGATTDRLNEQLSEFEAERAAGTRRNKSEPERAQGKAGLPKTALPKTALPDAQLSKTAPASAGPAKPERAEADARRQAAQPEQDLAFATASAPILIAVNASGDQIAATLLDLQQHPDQFAAVDFPRQFANLRNRKRDSSPPQSTHAAEASADPTASQGQQQADQAAAGRLGKDGAVLDTANGVLKSRPSRPGSLSAEATAAEQGSPASLGRAEKPAGKSDEAAAAAGDPLAGAGSGNILSDDNLADSAPSDSVSSDSVSSDSAPSDSAPSDSAPSDRVPSNRDRGENAVEEAGKQVANRADDANGSSDTAPKDKAAAGQGKAALSKKSQVKRLENRSAQSNGRARTAEAPQPAVAVPLGDNPPAAAVAGPNAGAGGALQMRSKEAMQLNLAPAKSADAVRGSAANGSAIGTGGARGFGGGSTASPAAAAAKPQAQSLEAAKAVAEPAADADADDAAASDAKPFFRQAAPAGQAVPLNHASPAEQAPPAGRQVRMIFRLRIAEHPAAASAPGSE